MTVKRDFPEKNFPYKLLALEADGPVCLVHLMSFWTLIFMVGRDIPGAAPLGWA